MARYSTRTAWDTGESAFSAAIHERREAGLEILDLTNSNPTTCGFDYDAEAILSALQQPAALTYDPNPKGIPSARAAVAGYYADHNATVDPEGIVLTTSTSEAYSFLFRLLCDTGDQVLVAQPSYPLFDFIAGLDNVELLTYPLFQDFGWWIDISRLERRITPRTRAIVVVHPNNPTGHSTGAKERGQLEALCLRHNLALIIDEVFLDYSLDQPIQSFALGPHPVPTFVVSGLSKIAALPQMKVGWVACFGPDDARREALARLEVVADTFLSMNAPAQLALPSWLAGRGAIQRQILNRVQANLDYLEQSPFLVLPVEAGWSAIVRLPSAESDANRPKSLVRRGGIVTHPGSFYGLSGANYIVLSLLIPDAIFTRGIDRMVELCEPEKLT